jgi:Ca2+-binding EF-hand superfamily protein
MLARIAIAAALSAACSLSVAAPAEPQATTRPGLSSLDKNGDGVVSREEASGHARLAESFDRIDANKDGLLSPDELHAARRSGHHGHPGQHGHQGRLDANGDGSISRDEAKGAPRLAANFDAMDANKDGVLTRDEMLAWRKANPRPSREAPPEPVKP